MFKYLVLLTLLMCLNNAECRRKCCNGKKSLTTVSGTEAPRRICPGELIFEENFHKLDFKRWQHENTLSGGGNWEFQWYTNNRSNSFVKDGVLHLKPTLTSEVVGQEELFNHTVNIHGFNTANYCTDQRFWGCVRTGEKGRVLNPIRSAKLTTVDSFSFKYGKIQIRAKMPLGDWLRPAIWMLPRYEAYGPWPGSGTIVMAECRGNEVFLQDGINTGIEQIQASLHWGPDVTHDGYDHAVYTKRSPGNGFHTDFRIYELEWTPDYMKFLIDGEVLQHIQPNQTFWELGQFDSNIKDNPYIYGSKMAPFDEEFYLIINLAVGGVFYFPDTGMNEKPWSNLRESAMTDFWTGRDSWLKTWKLDEGNTAALQIDYIKIWAL